jgi:hypothetical protein
LQAAAFSDGSRVGRISTSEAAPQRASEREPSLYTISIEPHFDSKLILHKASGTVIRLAAFSFGQWLSCWIGHITYGYK